MLTIGINDTNDIYLDAQGNLAVKKDIEAMGDIYINKVQTLKGELVYNTDKGVDYFNTIFGEPVYLDVFQNQVINELTDTAGTLNITNYQAETANGVYSYIIDCQTDYGNIALHG